MSGVRTVLYNAISAGSSVRGVERYHLGVLPHLPQVEPRIRVRVLRAPWQEYYGPLAGVDGLELVEVTPPRGRLPRAAWQLLDGGVRGESCDLLHLGNVIPLPIRVGRPVVAMVHDLIEYRTSNSYSGYRRWARRRLIRRLGREAAALVTVTEDVSADLANLAGLPRERVLALGIGVDPLTGWQPVAAVGREPCLVFVGALDRHKRLDLVLEALVQLPDLELRIVSGGGPEEDHLRRLADRLDVATRVRWLGRLGDDEARRVVSHSVALIMPSDEEGFGLPVLEALQVGTPVILSSRLPLAREWEGRGGPVFRAGDPEDLARAATGLLADAARQERLGREGLKLAAGYTWPRVAARLREVWDRVLAGGSLGLTGPVAGEPTR